MTRSERHEARVSAYDRQPIVSDDALRRRRRAHDVAVEALLEALRDAPSNLESLLVELLTLSQVNTAPDQIRRELDLATGRSRELLERVVRAR